MQALIEAHTSCNLDLDWKTWPLDTHAPWLAWIKSCYKRASSALLHLDPLLAQIAFPTGPGPCDHDISDPDLAAVEGALLRLGHVGCQYAGCAAHGWGPLRYLLLLKWLDEFYWRTADALTWRVPARGASKRMRAGAA